LNWRIAPFREEIETVLDEGKV
jgi:hypothetical protein